MKKSNQHKDYALKTSNKEILKLNFASGDLPSLDPHELTSVARGVTLGKYLFEGLTRLNLKGEYELAGAEKVDISPCQTRYTFTLRPNYYADGTLVVARDYERSWKAALATDSKCLKSHLLYCIKGAKKAKKGEIGLDKVGIEALDDKTLAIELKHPTAHFLGLLSLPLFAPFKVEKNKIVTNGPYKVVDRKEDDYLNLEASPFFWDYSNIAIKKVNISLIRDGMTALALYENGEIDWIGDPFSWLSSDIIGSEVANGNFFKGKDVLLPFWLYLNTNCFPLSSPLIRHALSCVIDRNEVAKHIFVGDEPLFTPISYKHSLTQHGLDNDIEKGKKLFEKGLKELGLTKETFPALKLSSCGLANHKRVVEYLQERWQTIFGIQVDLDIQEWNAFYANIASGNYEVGGYFTSSDYNDPLACLEILADEMNHSNWESEHYRQVIDKLKPEKDIQIRLGLLKKAEDILKEEMPIIWLVNRAQYRSYRSDLKGLCFDQQGLPDLRWAYFE